MKLNVVIVEDEKEELKQTVGYLNQFSKSEKFDIQIDAFKTSDEYLESDSFLQKKVHLYLLDIIMDGKNNGIELARKIREVNKDVAIMFITKTASFAINGYEVGAVDYVLKPVIYQDFALKMKKTMRYILLHNDKTLIFRLKDSTVKVNESQIYYIEVIRHYLTVHSAIGEFTFRGTMTECEEQMGHAFARTSNSYLVNLRYVENVGQTSVTVHGELVPLTKLKKNEFIDSFNAYVGAL